jgi:uncharacterized membrane protein required for colicin V production
MMFKNRWVLMQQNWIMYHVIMFVSLIVAVKLYPIFLGYAATQIAQESIQSLVAYVGVYIAAIFVLPEILCMIYMMLTAERRG